MKSVTSVILLTFLCLSVLAQNTGSKLSNSEANEMVEEHNKWRADVGTEELTWSVELAEIAQEWADIIAEDCNIRHSDIEYGENLYWSSAASIPKDAVDLWAEEKKHYHGQKITENNYLKVGHYTQMVWYNTTKVGCGKATCEDGTEVWVCNYDPMGNYLGEKAYDN